MLHWRLLCFNQNVPICYPPYNQEELKEIQQPRQSEFILDRKKILFCDVFVSARSQNVSVAIVVWLIASEGGSQVYPVSRI